MLSDNLYVNKVIKSCLKIQTLAISNPSVYSALGLIGEVVFLNVRDNNLSQITNGYLTLSEILLERVH